MNKRQAHILEVLHSRPFVSIKELENMHPEVSGMTIRRDIDYFQSIGEVIKVRGGARSTKYITTAFDDSMSARLEENVDAKIRIAKKAAERLEAGRSIFLDSGSTIQQIIPFVPNERLSLVTTNPFIALEISRIGLPAISIAGGRLDRDYQSVTGTQAMRFIADINIDVAFLSPSGFSLKSGFTGGNCAECELKKAVVEKADTVVMLMDVSKLGKSLPYTFSTLENVNVLIVDAPLPEELNKAAWENGVRVITV